LPLFPPLTTFVGPVRGAVFVAIVVKVVVVVDDGDVD
jgi:hypothetical protein